MLGYDTIFSVQDDSFNMCAQIAMVHFNSARVRQNANMLVTNADVSLKTMPLNGTSSS